MKGGAAGVDSHHSSVSSFHFEGIGIWSWLPTNLSWHTRKLKWVRTGPSGSFLLFFFFLIAAVPALHGAAMRLWAFAVAAAFVAVAFLAPRVLQPLNLIWFKFGLLLHHVVNPVVMALMFYGAILPMAVLLRWVGKDLLRLKSRSPKVRRIGSHASRRHRHES